MDSATSRYGLEKTRIRRTILFEGCILLLAFAFSGGQDRMVFRSQWLDTMKHGDERHVMDGFDYMVGQLLAASGSLEWIIT